MLIHGNVMGNMVGEPTQSRQRYPGEFAKCPSCGGQMHSLAELCHECHIEHIKAFGLMDDPAVLDRRERFTMALEAGWSIPDLMELCRRGQLSMAERGKRQEPLAADNYQGLLET